MKRIILLILCVAMCVPLFVACDSDEPKDTVASTTPNTTGSVSTDDVTEKKSEYEGVAKNNYDGYLFKIYYMDDYLGTVSKDFVCSNPNGNVLNDQVYQRNTMVETDYNINIFVQPYTGNTEHETLLYSQYVAGWTEGDYNMVAGFGRGTLAFSTKGYMADLGSYDEIDLYKEYWEQGFIDELMIDDSIYAILGDISLTVQLAQQSICFNKNLFKQRGFDEPYDLVRTYEWTVDRLIEYMDGFAQDYDSDGYDWDKDRFAISGWAVECAYGLFYASGFKYAKNDGETITLDFDREFLDDVIDKTIEVWGDNGACFINTGKSADHHKPHEVFATGRGLFCDITLGKIAMFFTDMDDDYGVLPEPMFNEEQKQYYSYTAYTIPMIVVPATDPNPSRTGNIIEAFCAASADVVIPKMYEIVTKIQNARDEDSAEMIDIICKTQAYDASHWLGLYGIEGMIRSLIQEGTNISASYLKTYYATAEKNLNDFMEAYAALKSK